MVWKKRKKRNKKIFIIGNMYVVKKDNKDRLIAENLYLSLYKSANIENVVFFNKNFNFAVYKYEKGNEIELGHNNIIRYIYQLSRIVSIYKNCDLDGYGDVYNTFNTWEDFLKNEINNNCIWIEEKDKYKIVLKAVDSLKKYRFFKKIIHGDMGVFNIIFEKNNIKKIIDPRTIIGDPLYDIIYFIFSKPKMINSIDIITDIINIVNEPREKIIDMMVIVLYIRIAIHKKYGKNTSYYEKIWDILIEDFLTGEKYANK